MSLNTLSQIDTDYYFPGLKHRFNSITLLPKCIRFYVLPISIVFTEDENIDVYKRLSFISNDFYIVSDLADINLKRSKIAQVRNDIPCRKTSLTQLKNSIDGLIQDNKLSAVQAQCFHKFIDSKLAELQKLETTLDDDSLIWVIEYNLANQTFGYYKLGDSLNTCNRLVFAPQSYFLSAILYPQLSDERMSVSKIYLTEPNLKDDMFTLSCLGGHTMYDYVGHTNNNQYIDRFMQHKRDMSFETDCAQLDFGYTLQYYTFDNVRLNNDLLQNDMPAFDYVIHFPNDNTDYMNTFDPNNTPDQNLRVRLSVFIKDAKGFVGEITYASRPYTHTEMTQTNRVMGYIQNIVDELHFIRQDINIFTDCKAKADDIINMIDSNIDTMENMLQANLKFIADELRNYQLPAF